METSKNYNDTSGYNPLFLAVHNGQTNLVPSLLKKYSVTEAVQGKTLINIAAAKGHEEIVRLLNTERDAAGNTPLHIAIKENQPSVFNILIKECNLNAKNCSDETPLHYAAAYDRVEFAKILIENGASVNVRDSKDKTPLFYALKVRKNVELAEILFKNGAILTEVEYNLWTPLYTAADDGNLEMVKLLMNNGWNVIDNSKTCLIPLKSAVMWGHLKIVEYMLKNGSKSDKTITEDSLSLLNISIGQGHLSVFKFLINAGVKSNKNLLADSELYRQHEIWRYLLTCRSKIITDSYFSETELHRALRARQLETLKTIVNLETNTVQLDSSACKLAVYIAVENGNEDILQVLLNAGYSTERCFDDVGPLHLAATFKHTRLVELLLRAGADVNSETKNGYTPLHFAAAAGRLTLVKFLLESGANPLKSGEKYDSPLSFALNMLTSGTRRLPVAPLMFKNLVKITKILILQVADENFQRLLLYAIGIYVHGDDNKQNSALILNPKEGTSCDYNNDDENSQIFSENSEIEEFRPEIVRCIFNHLKHCEINRSSESLLQKGYLLELSPEALHALMEYNDSNFCDNFEIDWWYHFKVGYMCHLLAVDYSRNVSNLLQFQFDFLLHKAYNKEGIARNLNVLQLIIARLVLLTNNSDSRVSKFCRKYKHLDWREKCEQQKVNMQKTEIGDNFNVTFYDILSKPVDKIANYARNEKFLKIVESSSANFPAYTDFIKLRLEKGIRRKDLIEECSNLMHSLIKKNHKIQFSTVDVDQIFRYLSVVDLRKLSEAFS